MQETMHQAVHRRAVVRLLAGDWRDTLGTLVDAVPGTDWYNVLVRPDLRLALRADEFAVLP